jgi:hypothetical protein
MSKSGGNDWIKFSPWLWVHRRFLHSYDESCLRLFLCVRATIWKAGSIRVGFTILWVRDLEVGRYSKKRLYWITFVSTSNNLTDGRSTKLAPWFCEYTQNLGGPIMKVGLPLFLCVRQQSERTPSSRVSDAWFLWVPWRWGWSKTVVLITSVSNEQQLGGVGPNHKIRLHDFGEY